MRNSVQEYFNSKIRGIFVRYAFGGVILLINILPVFAYESRCSSIVRGYKVVKNSTYPFVIGKEQACFFAFYIPNPNPTTDIKGYGNMGDSLWYGYYKIENPTKIYEFPKPSDTDWSDVCTIDAVSFYDMNGDHKSDVTVIGSCDDNVINFSVPFVFIQQDNKYIFNKKVYKNLFGFTALTVADVREYMKSPDSYHKVLANRYK